MNPYLNQIRDRITSIVDDLTAFINVRDEKQRASPAFPNMSENQPRFIQTSEDKNVSGIINTKKIEAQIGCISQASFIIISPPGRVCLL
jgi:hypothetical protein